MNYQKVSYRIKVSWLKWRGAYQCSFQSNLKEKQFYAGQNVEKQRDNTNKRVSIERGCLAGIRIRSRRKNKK